MQLIVSIVTGDRRLDGFIQGQDGIVLMHRMPFVDIDGIKNAGDELIARVAINKIRNPIGILVEEAQESASAVK